MMTATMRVAGRYGYRAMFALVILAVTGYIFWLESRYPNLNDKALMGGAFELQDPLSFEARYQLDPGWPLWKKIGYTTINWVYTNRRGMMFGVIFGAAFLTLLRYLPKKSFGSGYANAALGLGIGAPLGVCVNCASPIAAGMYAGGSRAETTLAAMIASPTFNVIVVSMLFALMPFYIAVTKIALTLFVILVLVPVICRFLVKDQLQVEQDAVGSCIINPPGRETNSYEKLIPAIGGFLRDILRDFWFIIRMTVPLMILAGFLGSIVATMFPFEAMMDMPVNAFTLVGAAILGVLAPVPMAFDVVLAAILLNSGVPIALVMVLLFTLGSYSIYSYIVISRAISQRAAFLVAAAIAVTGVIGGAGVEVYRNWQTQRALEYIEGAFESLSPISSAQAAEPQWRDVAAKTDADIKVKAADFGPRSPEAKTLFTREEAWHRGVDRPNGFNMQSMGMPFNFTPGSVAAADIDNDGDEDVVATGIDNDPGLMFFMNDGAGKFTPNHPAISQLKGKTIYNAAPVDIDNDGWIDLVATTHLDGAFLLKNTLGQFSDASVSSIRNRDDALLALVVGFGDIDRDGDLDMAFGNHQGTRQGRFPTGRAINRILFNEDGVLTGETFMEHGGVPGDTLSTIFSDFNMDGFLDYAEANDFNQPDLFFFGNGAGGFRQIRRADGIIPVTTHTTMSIKTADLDNDGKFEMLLTQIAGRADDMSGRLHVRPWQDFCKDIERLEDQQACQRNVDIRSWYRLGRFGMDMGHARYCDTLPKDWIPACKAMIKRDIAIQQKLPEMCDTIPAAFARPRVQCRTMFEILPEPKGLDYPEEVPQVRGRNVLLTPGADGKFLDVTKQAALEIGGWSWDVKIAAFDNQELPGIMIFNGFWGLQNVMPSKIFLANNGGLKFTDKTIEAGVEDYAIIPSAAAADYDRDGDLDMIAATMNGPLVSYWNNAQKGNSILVDLRDQQGNRFGVGAKVRIFYGGEAKKQQIRELQLSGGFSAFDAPYMHFGLGDFTEIARLEVEWSTGQRSVIAGPLPANVRYRVERGPRVLN